MFFTHQRNIGWDTWNVLPANILIGKWNKKITSWTYNVYFELRLLCRNLEWKFWTSRWIWQNDDHNECVNKCLWSSVVNSVMCYHAVNINIHKLICILLVRTLLHLDSDDNLVIRTEIDRLIVILTLGGQRENVVLRRTEKWKTWRELQISIKPMRAKINNMNIRSALGLVNLISIYFRFDWILAFLVFFVLSSRKPRIMRTWMTMSWNV